MAAAGHRVSSRRWALVRSANLDPAVYVATYNGTRNDAATPPRQEQERHMRLRAQSGATAPPQMPLAEGELLQTKEKLVEAGVLSLSLRKDGS